MSKNERYFLNGIIRAMKPKKILEVGVANGGGTSIILNAISDIEGANLYSVDYTEKSYRYPDKPSGFLVEEKFPQFLDKWRIFRGGDVSRFIEEVGGGIELFMLDTVHTHPWETLNFLCVLPFMKIGSWVVLHDITLFMNPSDRHALACGYLYAGVVSDEKVTPAPDNPARKFANIGAFRVSEATVKYVNNLFEMLLVPWNIQVSGRDLEDISRIIQKYYSPEQYRFFCDALEFQEYMFKHPANFHSKVRHYLQEKASAKTYSFLSKIRRSLRRFKI
ncbi:MAG: class I SAM-dependent methyltransferase [Synergistaceae bacterium]|nr:class I SAM-dependent methyltransferase [Synergistaceae bacterium]